jgi:hypothetical protein
MYNEEIKNEITLITDKYIDNKTKLGKIKQDCENSISLLTSEIEDQEDRLT